MWIATTGLGSASAPARRRQPGDDRSFRHDSGGVGEVTQFNSAVAIPVDVLGRK